MKQALILTLTLVMVVFTGCVSNKAFRTEQKKLQTVEADLRQNEEELVVLRKEIMQTRRNVTGLDAGTADVEDIEQLNRQLLQNEQDMKSLIFEHSKVNVALGELSDSVQEADQAIVEMIRELENRINKLESGGTKPGQTSPPEGMTVDEWSAYEKARDVYFDGNFSNAIVQLDKYLVDYPNSKYAGHAVYWKGESNYAMGNMPNALREFQTVISRYPKSWKVEDAQLKIGMCYKNMGDHQAARSEFNKLKKDSPKYYRMDLVDRFLGELK
ncbi:MAG: tetratricopeptide repeat protein [Candidatus Cloacimonetes bacterium]|jgi:tol-pal system protein YbgF|nr:tetratricopeptide repeat protein [Candidatus Cloacimonadota bacterium]MDD2424135.1 tetratricopeptide repeat protein [Candidatus Cloacimonadota bacterium]MDD3563182.1 tetratricopeptide repeat protein [Candidatus Cloacimonadota bacterium]MDD4277545.1 tetratricopeptide repeat protein [Candidatus Cloacimonadota bacterium]MDY0326407.1 tetratricopeptide repeat protein [Candidatus Cloacimonadaceae bacterium]